MREVQRQPKKDFISFINARITAEDSKARTTIQSQWSFLFKNPLKGKRTFLFNSIMVGYLN